MTKDPMPSPAFPKRTSRQLWQLAVANHPRDLPTPAPLTGQLSENQRQSLQAILADASAHAGPKWTGLCIRASMEMARRLTDADIGQPQVVIGNLWQGKKPYFATYPKLLRQARSLLDLMEAPGIAGYFHAWVQLNDGTLVDPSFHFSLADHHHWPVAPPILVGHVDDRLFGPDRRRLTFQPIQILSWQAIQEMQYLPRTPGLHP